MLVRESKLEDEVILAVSMNTRKGNKIEEIVFLIMKKIEWLDNRSLPHRTNVIFDTC